MGKLMQKINKKYAYCLRHMSNPAIESGDNMHKDWAFEMNKNVAKNSSNPHTCWPISRSRFHLPIIHISEDEWTWN